MSDGNPAATKLRELRARLRGVDVDALYAEFRSASGDDDLDRFVAHLHERGLIDGPLVRDVYAADPIEVMRLVAVEADGTLTLAPPDVTRSLPQGPSPAPAAAKATSGADRYAILGRLGAGGMGEVLVAKDRELRRKVAFKRMLEAAAAQGDLADRFFGEAQVTAQLDHPNIVPIYALEVSAAGVLGYSMKLVQGRTLREIVDEACRAAPGDDPGDEPKRLAMRLDHFLKVCDAVAYAHGKGVIHRDLKPENIMIGRYNQVYLMDWGLCRVVGGVEQAADSLVSTHRAAAGAEASERGALLGTPRYMSPEQAQGRNSDLDALSDEYALGLILQELVTLLRAVTAASLPALLQRAARGERDAVSHVAPRTRIAPEIRAIIDKATAIAPKDRYPSVEAFAADLRAFLRGEAVVARPDNLVQRSARWLSRHRNATLIAMLSLLLAGAAATSGALFHEQQSLERARRREQRLERFATAAEERANEIDSELSRYEKILENVAGHVTEALTRGIPGREPVYWSADFDLPGHGPPDLAPSAYYGRPVSLEWPVFQAAPGVEPASIADDARRLAPLRTVFRSALYASLGDSSSGSSAEVRQRLAERGAPVFHLFVSLRSGLHEAYPGWGGYPATYDARRRPKYLLAENRRGLRWGNAYGSGGGRLLLPCSTAIYDDQGGFLGVAGLDLTFETIRDRLIHAKDEESVSEAFLADERGRAVVHASRSGVEDERPAAELNDDAPLDLHPLPFEAAVREIVAGRSGHVELEDGRVVELAPLESLPWTYVVVADGVRLFGDDRR